MLAVGDLKIWAILSIISGCLNLPISYFFGKYFGMEWVVMGMCISMVPLFIFMFYKSLYELKLSLQSVLSQSIIPAFKSCLPLILLSLLSYSWYQFAALENGILFLLFFMFIFSFIWFSGMWIFGLNKNEKERLLSLIKFYKMYS
jgi:hypothetical protein